MQNVARCQTIDVRRVAGYWYRVNRLAETPRSSSTSENKVVPLSSLRGSSPKDEQKRLWWPTNYHWERWTGSYRAIIEVRNFGIFFSRSMSAIPLNKLVQFRPRNGSSRFLIRLIVECFFFFFFFLFSRVKLFLNIRFKVAPVSLLRITIDRSVVKTLRAFFSRPPRMPRGWNEVAVACNTRHIRGYHENEKVILVLCKNPDIPIHGTFSPRAHRLFRVPTS